MKKKILSCIILVSIVLICFNIVTGIVQANYDSEAFGLLIDNQTGEDITSISLMVRTNDKNSGKASEYYQLRSFQSMEPGKYEEFIIKVNNQEEVLEDTAYILIAVKKDTDEAYTNAESIGVPIKDGKRTLIKLTSNNTSGLRAEFVELM